MKLFTTLICAGLATIDSSRALDVVMLGGKRVEADTVVARLKSPVPGHNSPLAAQSFAGQEHLDFVPGLMVLRKPAAPIRELSVNARAAALQTWIDELS